MGQMVAQINTWNFDMFKFAGLSRDHPLVSLGYVVLQVVRSTDDLVVNHPITQYQELINCSFQKRELLRTFDVDIPTFIKYLFVIEANYHKTNPYHNATHGADVMQSCHVLLGYQVVEVSNHGYHMVTTCY